MKQTSVVKLALRILIYVLGLFCLAMGVAFSVNSNLGVSPVNSLPYVISRISGAALSTCVIAVFCTYILLQMIMLRKEFKLINLTQILFSTIFGYFVDFSKWLLGDFTIPTYAGKLVMLAVSILFVALGVVLYLEVKLVPMPMEGVYLTIAAKTNRPFPTVKTIGDCVVVLVGIVLSVLFLHKLVGIREGTVITAVAVGKIIALLKKPLSPLLQTLCFGRSEPLQDGETAEPEIC